ncbi:MAG: hypothetical protein R3F43_17980 [bacterium]
MHLTPAPVDLLWRRAELLGPPAAAPGRGGGGRRGPGHGSGAPRRPAARARPGRGARGVDQYVVHGEALLRLPVDAGSRPIPIGCAWRWPGCMPICWPAGPEPRPPARPRRPRRPGRRGLYLQAARAAGDHDAHLAALRARIRLDDTAAARLVLAEHLLLIGRPSEALAELGALDPADLDHDQRARLALVRDEALDAEP